MIYTLDYYTDIRKNEDILYEHRKKPKVRIVERGRV